MGPEHISGGLDLDKLAAQIDELKDPSLERLRQWVRNAQKWAKLTAEEQIHELQQSLLETIKGVKRLEDEKAAVLKSIEKDLGAVLVLTKCDGTAQETADEFWSKICDCDPKELIKATGKYTAVLYWKPLPEK